MTQKMMKRTDRSITRFPEKLKNLLMATTHNKVTSIATNGVGGFNIRTYGKGMESFTICIPTKFKEAEMLPCFVSHTDTVSAKKPKRFELKDGILTNPDGVLGADDRAGVYILSEMMNKGIRGIYIFTNGEEIGGLGARACTKHQVFQDHLPNITAFIELDRQDDRDIALYGYDNMDLCKLFEDRGYKQAYGSYTDVVDFSEESGIACLNLSVGYTGQHTKHEDLVLADLDFTLDIMLHDLPQELYETKYVAEEDLSRPSAYGVGRSGWDSFPEKIECEICMSHDKLWYVDDMMLCEYCAGIEEEIPTDNNKYDQYNFDADSWYEMDLDELTDETEEV